MAYSPSDHRVDEDGQPTELLAHASDERHSGTILVSFSLTSTDSITDAFVKST